MRLNINIEKDAFIIFSVEKADLSEEVNDYLTYALRLTLATLGVPFLRVLD